jgi:hypothetical protein
MNIKQHLESALSHLQKARNMSEDYESLDDSPLGQILDDLVTEFPDIENVPDTVLALVPCEQCQHYATHVTRVPYGSTTASYDEHECVYQSGNKGGPECRFLEGWDDE